MLKTNTKKAKNNIKKYIMDIFDGENYDIEEPETFEETAKIIFNIFKEEAFRLKGNEQDLFIEWVKGLPSIIDTCYYYNRSAVKDLGEILEETEEERNKFSESQAEEMLTKLIYREIKKAL